MLNKITLIILAALLVAGSYLNELNYLLLVFGYASMYAVRSYYDGFRRGAGLVTSTIADPDPISTTFWVVYCVIVAAIWKYYPIWGALVTPWIIHITLLNITAHLVFWGIIEFAAVDDEDYEDYEDEDE